MELPAWLTRDPDGYLHLAGHRIGLDDLVHFYRQGDSAEMLHCRFPTLALATIHKVLAFYLENQAVVDAYVEANAAAVAGQRSGAPQGPGLDELRRRREARRLAQGA
jgi:uncharacterized protein (DUF433 family)